MRARFLAYAFVLSASTLTVAVAHAQEPPPAPTPPAAEPASGQVRSGFVVEPHFGTSLFAVDKTVSLQLVEGGIFGGYKIDRFIFGLGFNILRNATGTSSSAAGSTDRSTAATAVMFLPGVRVAILRTTDQRVELFGQFDIGLGRSFSEQEPAPTMASDTSNFRLLYQLGPGVRYWVHPNFTLGMLAALRGDFSFNSTKIPNTPDTTTQSNGVTSIAASLFAAAVF